MNETLKFGPLPEREVGLEKAEMIARAKEIFTEMKQYDYVVVDVETNVKLKELNKELHKLMMDENITWDDFTQGGVKAWDPRFEIMKQATNNNRAPVEAAA